MWFYSQWVNVCFQIHAKAEIWQELFARTAVAGGISRAISGGDQPRPRRVCLTDFRHDNRRGKDKVAIVQIGHIHVFNQHHVAVGNAQFQI